jgi:hypothetical protein
MPSINLPSTPENLRNLVRNRTPPRRDPLQPLVAPNAPRRPIRARPIRDENGRVENVALSLGPGGASPEERRNAHLRHFADFMLGVFGDPENDPRPRVVPLRALFADDDDEEEAQRFRDAITEPRVPRVRVQLFVVNDDDNAMSDVD